MQVVLVNAAILHGSWFSLMVNSDCNCYNPHVYVHYERTFDISIVRFHWTDNRRTNSIA